MKKCLCIIDMLNDFCHKDGALYFPDAEKIIPEITDVINGFSAAGDPIVFICDGHGEEDLEFKRFPKHCIIGTWGAKVVNGLHNTCSPYMIIKNRYSGFFNTKLDDIVKSLDKEGVTEYYVVGVCTSICVMFTVEELCNRDKKVYVVKNAVADFNPDRHKFALEMMTGVLGAEIV